MPGFFSPLGAAPDASTHSAPPRRSSAEIDLFYLSGDYGADETTDIVYVPLILKAWGEAITAFLDITRKHVGDPPGTDYQDTTGLVGGISGRLSRRRTGG